VSNQAVAETFVHLSGGQCHRRLVLRHVSVHAYVHHAVAATRMFSHTHACAHATAHPPIYLYHNITLESINRLWIQLPVILLEVRSLGRLFTHMQLCKQYILSGSSWNGGNALHCDRRS